MIVISSDDKMLIDVGTNDILFSLNSTISCRLEAIKNRINKAIDFLEEGACSYENAREVANQFILIKEELSKLSPDKVIYNLRFLEKRGPWEGNLSEGVKSIADLYTTANGMKLLDEMIKILIYADETKTSVEIFAE